MFRECNVAPRDVRCWGSCKVPSLSARRAAMPSNVRYSGVQRMSRGLPPRSAYDPLQTWTPCPACHAWPYVGLPQNPFFKRTQPGNGIFMRGIRNLAECKRGGVCELRFHWSIVADSICE
jgi:hypothetical protein